jgi:hypothetical protein
MRARYWIAAALVLVAVVGGVLVVTGTTDSEAKTTPIRAEGVSAQMPEGWQQRSTDPKQLAAFTQDWFIDENCGAKKDYTTARVDVTPDPGFGPTPIPRPKHFNATQGTGVQTGEVYADIPCGSTSTSITFIDHGKTWKATVSLGRDTPKKQRVQAYRILDSFRVTSSN